MRKGLLILATLLFTSPVWAGTLNTQVLDYRALQASIMDEAETLGLPWKVGETADYKINMGFISGTAHMQVRELIAEGFWVQQDIAIMGQQQKVEILFDKNTGKILQLIVNGEKQTPPDAGDQEVVETKEAQITVPAGTFKTIYVKILNKKDNKTSEAWVNMAEIPIAGLVKQVSPGPMGNVTLELTAFNKL